MKAQNITVDINTLTVDELRDLAVMVYARGSMATVKTINDRIAFLEGWMSEQKEAEYIREYC